MENKKYSVLLIGPDIKCGHIDRFISSLKTENRDVSITLFADWSYEEMSDAIKNNIDGYIKRKRCGLKNKIPSSFRKIVNKAILIIQFCQLSKKYSFDIINIHYALPYLALVRKRLIKMSKRIIITPWGSDVLRAKNNDLKILRKLYESSNYITVGCNCEIGKRLRNVCGIAANKMVSMKWGSETIDYINEHLDSISTEDAKRKFGIEGKYVITCGYNAFKEQRHDEIIESMGNIKDRLPSNYLLVFPFTYGNSNRYNYMLSLEEKCKQLGLNTLFIYDYMDVQDVFRLRMSADLFIHVQATDAGNSTLDEYILCGKKIIHGSWIHYKKADYKPLFYYPVDDMKDLSSVILKAIESDNIIPAKELMSEVKNRGWKTQIKAWNQLFIKSLDE